jgi:hypothetical protein
MQHLLAGLAVAGGDPIEMGAMFPLRCGGLWLVGRPW